MACVDIEKIRERIRSGNYLIRSHAIQHAVKEGFDRQHMVEAILNGKIIEEYSDDQRVLLCSRRIALENTKIYLHVVCEYADPLYIELITAYFPDRQQWQNPPYKRRKQRKR